MTTYTDNTAWSTVPSPIDSSPAPSAASPFDAIAPERPLLFPPFVDEVAAAETPPVAPEPPLVAERSPLSPQVLPSRSGEIHPDRSRLSTPKVSQGTIADATEAVDVWGCPFSCLTMEQTLERIERIIASRQPNALVTANLNYLMLLDRSPQLQSFTRRAALVLCDGMPILWRSRLNQRSLPERVAGADLIYRLAERSAQRGWRVYLLGGAPAVTGEAARRLSTLYPGLTVCGVDSPPYGDWTPEERRDMNQRIIEASPDILLVAFGQPKGELWIDENLESLGVPLTMQIGASFDFVVGAAKRAPKWMQTVGAEWLYRALSEPRRLAPRYAANAWYLVKTIRQDLLRALS